MSSLTTVVKAVDFILKTPVLAKAFVPLGKLYCQYAGYRQIGLRFDDLIAEESDVMQTAIRRLPPSESYARNYRMLTAHQCAFTHHLLPESKQLKPEDDIPYLTPYILEAEAEAAERELLDNIVVTPSAAK